MFEVFKKNAFVRYFIFFLLGAITVYFLLPTKIHIKEVQVEVVRYVKTKSKEDIVIVKSKDGTVTTRIKRDTDVSEDIKSKSASYEKTIINPRWSSVELGFGTDRAVYGHAQTRLAGPLIIGMHAAYRLEERKGYVGAGLGLNF